jgi:hypothetical protein
MAPEVNYLWLNKAKSKCGIPPLLKSGRCCQRKIGPNNSSIPLWIRLCRSMQRTPNLIQAVSTGYPKKGASCQVSPLATMQVERTVGRDFYRGHPILWRLAHSVAHRCEPWASGWLPGGWAAEILQRQPPGYPLQPDSATHFYRTSVYYGGFLALNKRFSRDLQFTASYALGWAFNANDSTGDSGSNVTDSASLKRDYGPSSSDQRPRSCSRVFGSRGRRTLS